jgi:hypothetical protein
MLSAIELSAAIAHGRWATAIRAIDRRRSTIAPATASAWNRSALATRGAAARCSVALSTAGDATTRGTVAAWRTCVRWSAASAAAARPRVARLARVTSHFTHHLAIGAARAVRASAAGVSRWSIAVASFAAERARRGSTVAGPMIRQATLFTTRNARFASAAAGRWLRTFAGTDATEEVFELDLVDLVPLEERLLTGIGSPPLPTFDIATSNDVELEFRTDERSSDVCSPAVVRLAKMSGQEARVDCSPISVTASTWRPVRMSRARFTARG